MERYIERDREKERARERERERENMRSNSGIVIIVSSNSKYNVCDSADYEFVFDLCLVLGESQLVFRFRALLTYQTWLTS